MIHPASGPRAPHSRAYGRALLLAIPVGLAPAPVPVASVARDVASDPAAELAIPAASCDRAGALAFDPERIPLQPTGPDRGFSGYIELVFPVSPFGVTVSADGHSVYEVRLQLETVRRPETLPTLVAWATTPDLDTRVKLGAVDENLRVAGRVAWNKFLVLVTAESSADVETWEGPILLTAMSPSGWMHTMAGHGIFEGYSC